MLKSHVSVSIGGLTEIFSAKVAPKRLFSRVFPHVLLHIAHFLGAVRAELTFQNLVQLICTLIYFLTHFYAVLKP